jgi:hypothetical protein
MLSPQPAGDGALLEQQHQARTAELPACGAVVIPEDHVGWSGGASLLPCLLVAALQAPAASACLAS